MISWRLKRLGVSVWTDILIWLLWIIVLVFSIALPVYLGVHYLAMRGCQPHINLEIQPESIKSFITPKPDPELDVEPVPEIEEDLMTGLLVGLYPPEVGVKMGNISGMVARLPRTLYRQGTQFVQRELQDYSVKDVSALCSVNGNQEKGLISLGLAVCKESLKSEAGLKLQGWLDTLEPGVEDELVGLVLQGDLEQTIQILPKMFPGAGLNESHVESMQHLVRPFSSSELVGLAGAFRAANLTDKDLAVLNAVMGEASQSLTDVNSVLAKINPANLPGINENLEKLGIKLSTFISDPGVFLAFFGDPEKSKLLVNLQGLLPKFRPTDIEAFLVFSKELEAAQVKYGDPEAPSVMSKLFSIPLDVLLGALPKLKLSDETRFGLEALMLLMEDDKFQDLLSAAEEAQLLDSAGQQAFLQLCTDQRFFINCRDVKDHCPNGQILLGVSCLVPLLVPGLLYALSTFMHHRGYIMQCGMGKPFNMPKYRLAWILLLPFYTIFMLPWTLCLVVYRQSKVLAGLADEARGAGQPLEPDCTHFNNASSFGLLLGAGQGVLHLGVQAVILGVVLLAGDILLGMDKEYFTASTLIVTVISIVLASLVLGVSHLSSQEACRLSVDLATPPNSKIYLFSSLVWLVVSVGVTVASTLILSLLVYVDTLGFSEWRWSGVCIILLLPLPLIQCLIYQLCVRTGAEHRFAWGIMASMIPVRFLDMERRRARLFLILSQLAWLLTHSSAWILYAIFMHVTELNDVIWRTWIPVIIPVLLIPPLISFLHWSSSLSNLYSATHAHQDMQDGEKRRKSFPPNWNQMSGSDLTPENLSQAGFFYSCRRLKKGEATCFSCGRQVSEWGSRSAQEAHRDLTNSCPLYTDVKKRHLENDEDKKSSSCVPSFIFLSINLLFRLGSIGLFLFVFTDSWLLVAPSLPTLVLIPILFLIISWLLNPACYYACMTKTKVMWSLVSPLLPQPDSNLQYIAVNLAVNILLHFLLWAAMLGTSPTVVELSWPRLGVIWPILVALAGLSALSVVPYWCLALKSDSKRIRPVDKTVYVASTSL